MENMSRLASQQRAGVLLLVYNPDKMAESLQPTPESFPNNKQVSSQIEKKKKKSIKKQ